MITASWSCAAFKLLLVSMGLCVTRVPVACAVLLLRYFEMMGHMAGQSNTIVFGGDGPGDMRRMATELATVSAGANCAAFVQVQLYRCLSELFTWEPPGTRHCGVVTLIACRCSRRCL